MTYTGILDCIDTFQVLIAGVLALFAAIITAVGIYIAARVQINHLKVQERSLSERRERYGRLVLWSQLEALERRSKQATATIKTFIAANKDVTDPIRDRTYLSPPAVAEDWETMSLLPRDVWANCLNLIQKINEHNYDIAKAGGAFGADNFRSSLLTRLGEIGQRAASLRASVAWPD